MAERLTPDQALPSGTGVHGHVDRWCRRRLFSRSGPEPALLRSAAKPEPIVGLVALDDPSVPQPSTIMPWIVTAFPVGGNPIRSAWCVPCAVHRITVASPTSPAGTSSSMVNWISGEPGGDCLEKAGKSLPVTHVEVPDDLGDGVSRERVGQGGRAAVDGFHPPPQDGQVLVGSHSSLRKCTLSGHTDPDWLL